MDAADDIDLYGTLRFPLARLRRGLFAMLLHCPGG